MFGQIKESQFTWKSNNGKIKKKVNSLYKFFFYLIQVLAVLTVLFVFLKAGMISHLNCQFRKHNQVVHL